MATFFKLDRFARRYECLIDFHGPRICHSRKAAYFGVSSLRQLGELEWRQAGPLDVRDETGERTWCIVKHEHERVLELPVDVTKAQAVEFGAELGIALWQPHMHPESKAHAFYNSPAFDALQAWVRAHRSAARGFAKDSESRAYLPDWYERALANTARLRAAPWLRLVHSR